MRFINIVMTILVISTPFILACALLAGGPIVAIKAVLSLHAFGVAALMAYSAVIAFTREG